MPDLLMLAGGKFTESGSEVLSDIITKCQSLLQKGPKGTSSNMLYMFLQRVGSFVRCSCLTFFVVVGILLVVSDVLFYDLLCSLFLCFDCFLDLSLFLF